MAIIGISGKIGSGKDEIGKMIQYLTSEHYRIDKFTYVEWLNYGKLNYQSENWQIKKYADKLKDITCLLIGCTREQLESQEFKEQELGEEWDEYYNSTTGKDEVIKMTPRLMLQLLGTECGREIIHPNIWVNSLMVDYKSKFADKDGFTTYDKIENAMGEDLGIEIKMKDNPLFEPSHFPNWIITDCRFPNEAKAIKDKEGITIRVNRWKKGDIVYWDDPEGLTSQVYKIKEINEEDCFLTNEYSETEALYSEISLFKDPQHESETALDDYTFDYVINNNGSIENLIEKVKQILIKENLIN